MLSALAQVLGHDSELESSPTLYRYALQCRQRSMRKRNELHSALSKRSNSAGASTKKSCLIFDTGLF